MAAVPCLSGSSDTDALTQVPERRIDEELDAPRLADHPEIVFRHAKSFLTPNKNVRGRAQNA